MQDNTSLRWITIGFFSLLGIVIGVLLVPGFSDNGKPFLVGAIMLAVIVFIVIALIFFRSKEKKIRDASGGARQSSEMGFMVNTFHDLLGRLKEKERELASLKAFAEEKASNIEAYNENVLQSIPSGVISIDNLYTIKSINTAAGHILGVKARDVTGKRITDVLIEPMRTIISDSRNIARGEYQYVTVDNRHIWLGVSNSVLKNEAGEKIGMIYVFTDLTNIKALQAQVELKQRLSQLGEMSAGIAHELRNSMSVISGYVKLLDKKVNDVSRPTVDSIQSEIQNMDRIISELLSFAKPTEICVSSVSVNDLFQQIISSIPVPDSIRISTYADCIVYVSADEILLKQALSNLVINAVEAMPNGGSLEIRFDKRDDKAEISIQDTGCGISETTREKIFLPFYTTKAEGTGFGLALVHKIIISHGGTIGVESEEGKGTVFSITLPVPA